MNLMLADIGGSGLVHDLFAFLIIGVCCLIVWALGRWAITALGAPAMAMTIWTGLFIFVGAIILINFLLGLAGHPFIRYWD
jgi:hypothetical protein